jgi:bacitracin transport system permease protein
LEAAALLNLVYCELIKLKRSKIVLFSVFGVLATPLMMLAEAFQTHFEHPERIFSLSDIYQNSLLYVMLLTSMLVYVAIAAYLFSREYAEKTLKMILPVPVSRFNLITGKFLVLLIWTAGLTILTWAAILALMLIYHLAVGLEGMSLQVAGLWLFKFLLGSVLMFLTLSPFAYIAEKSQGFVVPVIVSAVVVMGSAALCNQAFGALYPWTAGLLLVEGKIQGTGYPLPLAIAIIGIVSLTGFIATYRYFEMEDIK